MERLMKRMLHWLLQCEQHFELRVGKYDNGHMEKKNMVNRPLKRYPSGRTWALEKP